MADRSSEEFGAKFAWKSRRLISGLYIGDSCCVRYLSMLNCSTRAGGGGEGAIIQRRCNCAVQRVGFTRGSHYTDRRCVLLSSANPLSDNSPRIFALVRLSGTWLEHAACRNVSLSRTKGCMCPPTMTWAIARLPAPPSSVSNKTCLRRGYYKSGRTEGEVTKAWSQPGSPCDVDDESEKDKCLALELSPVPISSKELKFWLL